jgi:hypothetical protein
MLVKPYKDKEKRRAVLRCEFPNCVRHYVVDGLYTLHWRYNAELGVHYYSRGPWLAELEVTPVGSRTRGVSKRQRSSAET